jgi:hypothetical protein
MEIYGNGNTNKNTNMKNYQIIFYHFNSTIRLDVDFFVDYSSAAVHLLVNFLQCFVLRFRQELERKQN